MAHILPWVPVNTELVDRAMAYEQRLNANTRTEPWASIPYPNLTSRMLKDAWRQLKYFNIAQREWTTLYNVNTADEQRLGLFEGAIVNILCCLLPDIKRYLERLLRIRDRGNDARYDIFNTNDSVGLGYFPKGITDFAPNDKTYHAELSAKLQREIIRDNGNDPMLPDNHDDKKITIKAFVDVNYVHIYFNKRSVHTIRRIYFKAFWFIWNHFNLARYGGTEAAQYDTIVANLCYPTTDSAELILNTLNGIVEKHMKQAEENLIEDFSKAKQKAMNSTRKASLDNALAYAKQNYDDNIARYACLHLELINCQKALNDYTEIDFTAVADFLTRIKEYPRTKAFGKLDSYDIQFTIEEPMIHTDPKTWARYLTNADSIINQHIRQFVSVHTSNYNTTQDILRFATQRFIKETFVDQHIRIFTQARFSINSSESNFKIHKLTLPDNSNCMPHPHIATNDLTCWGDAEREIAKCILENNGETAFLQLTYALQQMTASDTVVLRRFIEYIFHSRYHTINIYQIKGQTERTSFQEIIKEFVKNETDKINAISETDA
jgi:hypothetical protein